MINPFNVYLYVLLLAAQWILLRTCHGTTLEATPFKIPLPPEQHSVPINTSLKNRVYSLQTRFPGQLVHFNLVNAASVSNGLYLRLNVRSLPISSFDHCLQPLPLKAPNLFLFRNSPQYSLIA